VLTVADELVVAGDPGGRAKVLQRAIEKIALELPQHVSDWPQQKLSPELELEHS